MQNFKNFIIRAMALSALLAVPSLSGCGDKENGEGPSESTFSVPEQPITKNNYASQNNTITVVASGDVAWTAAKDDSGASWLSITSAGGKGNGNVVFSLTEKENPGMRSTTVTITGQSVITGREFSGTVTVRQMGTDPTIIIDPVGAASIPFDANNAYSVAVTSNVVWTASLEIVSGGDGWVSKVSPASGTEGNGTVVLSFLENAGDESRQVKLTVVSADDPSVNAQLTVTQQKPGVRYSIVFEGMTTLLGTVSSTTLSYAPAAGGAASTLGDVEVEVDMTEKKTTVFYADIIPDGEYELRTVGSINVNALFTLAGGIVTYVERWDAPLGQFGGETEARPLNISAAAHLQSLATAVNDGTNYSGLYLLQTADIDLGGGNWTPIGVSGKVFSGIYDGNGKKVSKIQINAGDNQNYALFGFISGVDAENKAVVKKLTVEGSEGTEPDIQGTNGYLAGVVARMNGNAVVSECVNRAFIKGSVATGGSFLGGIVCQAANGNNRVEKCRNYGKIVVNATAANNNNGGIIGQAASTGTEIVECYNYADLEFIGNSGAIIGTANSGAVITRCANYGTLYIPTSSGRSGGIVGTTNGGVFRECFNAGHINAPSRNSISGIAGYAEGNAEISDCYNKGLLTFNGGNVNNAGILGNKAAATATVKNCYNSGTVTMTGNQPGGIFGGVVANRENVSLCYYLSTAGFEGGASQAGGAVDVAGSAEPKTEAEFTSGTAFAGWDTAVWKFESGQYPKLVNNPEQPL